MPTSIPLGAPIWVDTNSPDFDRDLEFYTELFGWKAVDSGKEFGHYTDLRIGESERSGRTVGGIVPESPNYLNASSRWTVQFYVADCAKATKRAEKLGGAVHIPPTPVADNLVYSMVFDPNGAMFGLFEPLDDNTGLGAGKELHAPAWFEYGYDGVPSEAMRFYADLLGWDVHVPPWTDSKDPRPYAALSPKDRFEEFGGCHAAEGAERELSSQWVVMFAVDNTDEACAMAEDLGGDVVGPPVETSMVRIADIRSPGGAVFGVMADAS
ncbi:VOC family protein [Glycomyces arizonensis]|uniref:VOC family protein n=1 Tax=Glycomyces arizonensis TaxID=256035 RepID=UPI00041D5C91|nr:VOC family protein [Glycomyces arizonensis]